MHCPRHSFHSSECCCSLFDFEEPSLPEIRAIIFKEGVSASIIPDGEVDPSQRRLKQTSKYKQAGKQSNTQAGKHQQATLYCRGVYPLLSAASPALPPLAPGAPVPHVDRWSQTTLPCGVLSRRKLPGRLPPLLVLPPPLFLPPPPSPGSRQGLQIGPGQGAPGRGRGGRLTPLPGRIFGKALIPRYTGCACAISHQSPG